MIWIIQVWQMQKNKKKQEEGKNFFTPLSSKSEY